MEPSEQPDVPGQGYFPTHDHTPNYLAAVALLKVNDPKGALAIFSREDPTSPCYGMAMAHAGLINLRYGQWEGAIADAQKALEAFDHFCPLPPMGVMARRTIADALAATERPLQSFEHYQVAINLADQLIQITPEFEAQLLREKAATLVHWGGTYLRVEQPVAAVESLQAARDLLRNEKDAVKIGLPEALENLAVAHHQTGTTNPEYALGEALALSGLRPDQELRLQLTRIQLLHPARAEAEPVVRKGISEAIAKGNPELGTMRCGMGVIAALANKELDWVAELMAIADGLEPQLPANSLWPARLSFYRAQLLQLANADPADIRKTLVVGAHQLFTRSSGRGQLADYQLLAGKTNDHFRQLARLCLDAGLPKEAFVAFEAGRARGIIAEMRNNLSHELTANCPFHPDGKVDLTLLDRIQGRLTTSDVVVTLASLPPDTVCFVVGSDTFDFFQVETPVSIGPELRGIAKRLSEKDGLSAIPEQAQHIARKIFELAGDRTLRAFVPFRSLHLVPWRAMLNEVGVPWGKLRFGVSFSPTFHVRHRIDLMQCEAIGHGSEQGIDFNAEAKEFADLFGSAGHFIADATKEDFRTALKKPSIVMVSCHGLLSEGRFGQNFHFALNGGKVRLDEVLPTQPRSPLIIFSACDSGAYEMIDGDYPVGAAPTIVLGGNAYCACTRFPIRAEFSRRFFSAFGRRLVAGRLPEDALADANAELAADGADRWRDLACIELLIRGD